LGLYLISASDRPRVWSGEPIFDFFLADKYSKETSAESKLMAIEDVCARAALPKQTPSRKNIILFIVDALRADHLSIYGYDRLTDPNLRALSHRWPSRKVDIALSNANESFGGISAILSSKNVSQINNFCFTLSDYLMDQGFDATMILSGNHHWYGLDQSYGKSRCRFIDGSRYPGPNGVEDDEMLVQEAARLDQAGDNRHFIYFHLMSVHDAGFIQEHFRQAEPQTIKGTGVPNMDSAADPYDQRILQADDVICRVMKQLEAKGYLNDFLCVVTADHGQLLGEHGNFGHGKNMAFPVLRIPILFFGSDLPTVFHSENAVQLDIAPTIVDLAGLQIPSSWQGISLCRGTTSQWSFHGTTWHFRVSEEAVVYRDASHMFKYSFAMMDPNNIGKQRIFDLIDDPTETTNLIDSPAFDPLLLNQLRRQSSEHFITK
jgi:glucan phosphoethanolaminetransferase (alkaline phosphatase superfamily)